MRGEEESPYDLITDMGLDDDNNRVFGTYQDKTHRRTTSRPTGGKGEPVARNGKDRNSYNYYDEDITYLATVNKHGRVVYYHKEQYKYLTPSQLKNANESVLPTNTKMQGYRVNTTVTNNSTLEEFIG